MTVVAAATAVCDNMHTARPGRGLRPFQVALFILGSRLAPRTSNLRGDPGHRSLKRINLSTSELCSEAPVLCAQSQSTSLSCGMHRKKILLELRAFVGSQGPHAGTPMAERPFVSPGQKGHGCRGTQAPSPPFSLHIHRPPPVLCSQKAGVRHGDWTFWPSPIRVKQWEPQADAGGCP